MSDTMVRSQAALVPAQSGGSASTPAVPAPRHSGETGEGLSFAELMDRLSGELASMPAGPATAADELMDLSGPGSPAPLFTPPAPRRARHAAPVEEPAGLPADTPPAGLTGSFFRGTTAAGGDGISLTGMFAALPRSPKIVAAAATTAVLGATAVFSGISADPAGDVSGDTQTLRLAAADAVLPAAGADSASTQVLPAVPAGPGVVGSQMQTAMSQAMGSLPAVFDKADAAGIAAVQKAAAAKAAEEQRTALARTARTVANGGAAAGNAVGEVIGQVAGSSVGAKALAAARTRLGMPYVWGAAGPTSFDCSGLTSWAFKQAGVTLPRTSSAQSTVGTPVSKAQLQPGDLVFFYSPVSHVGIYVGNGQILHASTSGQPVKISDMSTMPFHNARRI